MKAHPAPVVIVGGGLAGCLAALALAIRRPEVPMLLVEQESRFGEKHIWSFFDTDLEARHRWLESPLVSHRWPDHEVSFPRRRRRIGIGYNSVCSAVLDRVLREMLRPDQYRLGCRIAAIRLGELQLGRRRADQRLHRYRRARRRSARRRTDRS